MSRTENIGLERPNFDISPWHDLVNSNFTIIDSVFRTVIGLRNIKGSFINSTLVEVGERYYDGDDNTFYRVEVEYVTSAEPVTFAEERIAFPANWSATSLDDIVSQATQAIDAATAAAASAVAAAASETNAATSASSSAGSALSSAASAAGSATAAGASSDSAIASASSASNAATSETNSGTSATASAASASASAGSATAAATSATEAETAVNNFSPPDINQSIIEIIDVASLGGPTTIAIDDFDTAIFTSIEIELQGLIFGPSSNPLRIRTTADNVNYASTLGDYKWFHITGRLLNGTYSPSAVISSSGIVVDIECYDQGLSGTIFAQNIDLALASPLDINISSIDLGSNNSKIIKGTSYRNSAEILRGIRLETINGVDTFTAGRIIVKGNRKVISL